MGGQSQAFLDHVGACNILAWIKTVFIRLILKKMRKYRRDCCEYKQRP